MSSPIPAAATAASPVPANPRSRVVLASLIGTTIEFYDFYVYATAAVLVFPHLFFPTGNPTPPCSPRSPSSARRWSPARSAP